MKRLLSLAVGTCLVIGAPALAQEHKAEKPKEAPKAEPGKEGKPGDMSMDEMMKAYAAVSQPGPYHKWMAQLEGEWKSQVTMFGPDGKPMGPASMGKETRKLEMGGRFLDVDFEGEFMGQKFEGAGVMGYNNIEKRFESTWYDSMSTGVMMLTGQADKEGKVVTFSGEETEPDGTKSKIKEVLTIVSKGETRSDFYKMAGGKEMKTMEIVYTRTGDVKKEEHEGKKEMKEEKKAEKKEEKKDEKKSK